MEQHLQEPPQGPLVSFVTALCPQVSWVFSYATEVQMTKLIQSTQHIFPILELTYVLRDPYLSGNVCLAKCYDKDSDPEGATYDGCVSTTVSGRTCQV